MSRSTAIFGLTAFIVSRAPLAFAQSTSTDPLQGSEERGADAPPERVRPLPVELSIQAMLQVDWIATRQSSEDAVDRSTREPLNDRRFLLRSGRLRATAERELVGGWFELDANTIAGPEVRPFDAVLVFGWPTAFAAGSRQTGGLGDLGRAAPAPPKEEPRQLHDDQLLRRDLALSLAAGLQPIPFGFEAQEPVTRRPVLERARFARAFFGNARDLGATVHGAYRHLRLSVGLYNGEPLGTFGYETRDATARKDLVGRVGVAVALAPQTTLEAGWSWLGGHALSPGTAPTKDSVVWVDDNENGLVEVSELVPAPGTPGRPSQPFTRTATGADARLRVQMGSGARLELRGEMVRALNLDRALEPADPITTGRAVRQLGWVVGLSQQLFDVGELAARYDVYDPDADAARRQVATLVPQDRSYRTLSLAAAVRIGGARLLAQYDFEDNTLGRSTSGAPTRLPDDRLTFRAEVVLP